MRSDHAAKTCAHTYIASLMRVAEGDVAGVMNELITIKIGHLHRCNQDHQSQVYVEFRAGKHACIHKAQVCMQHDILMTGTCNRRTTIDPPYHGPIDPYSGMRNQSYCTIMFRRICEESGAMDCSNIYICQSLCFNRASSLAVILISGRRGSAVFSNCAT